MIGEITLPLPASADRCSVLPAQHSYNTRFLMGLASRIDKPAFRVSVSAGDEGRLTGRILKDPAGGCLAAAPVPRRQMKKMNVITMNKGMRKTPDHAI